MGHVRPKACTNPAFGFCLHMFAKIFSQIFDSSIAEDWQVRCVFTDLLTLCDINGVVDMTPEAISRRTNVPLEIVTRALGELQKPDPLSRSPDDDGRRIRLLDDHRTWGWMIINYHKYRQIASDEQRRQRTLDRVNRFRSKSDYSPSVTPCNAGVTPVNACNAMQKQRQKQMEVPLNPQGGFDVAEDIYKHYPRKVGKPVALKAIVNAIKRGADPALLLNLTISYAEKVKGTDTLIPNPSTWFNGDRFNDDPETWVRQIQNGETAHQLTKRKESVEKQMEDLKRRHYSETQSLIAGKYVPSGWRSSAAKQTYMTLKLQVSQLNERISKSV